MQKRYGLFFANIVYPFREVTTILEDFKIIRVVTVYRKLRFKYLQLSIKEHGKYMILSKSSLKRKYHYEKLIELSLKHHMLQTTLLQDANIKAAKKILNSNQQVLAQPSA